jgi:hypothetical protein
MTNTPAGPLSISNNLWRAAIYGGIKTGAQTLLGANQGLAIDFTDQSIDILDQTTPANTYLSNGILNTAGSLLGPGAKLTYSSPSPKLCLQSNGYYQYGPHNKLVRSNDFTAAVWNAVNLTITNNAIADPFGGNTGSKLQVTTTAGTIIVQGITAIGTSQQFNVYIKQGSGPTDGNSFVLYNNTTSTTLLSITINYNTGAITYVTGSTGATMTSVGGGWWLLQMVVTSGINPGNQINHYIGWQGNSDTAGRYMYACFASSGGYPRVPGYVATTSAPVYALPYEYNTGGVCQGILVEEARTNSMIYSIALNNAAWSKGGSSVTANADTSPDGTVNACRLVEDTSNGTHYISNVWTGVQSTTYTASFYTLKTSGNAANRYMRCYIYDANGTPFNWTTNLDTQAGTTTTGTTQGGGAAAATITFTSVSSTYWRVAITFTTSAFGANANCTLQFYRLDASKNAGYTGDGATYNTIWGVQVETGAFATSPVPTGSATVTRLIDKITIGVGSIPFSTTVGTLYTKSNLNVDQAGTTTDFAAFNRSPASASFMINLSMFGAAAPVLQVVDTTTQCNISAGTITVGTDFKSAGTWQANDYAFVFNGSAPATDNAGTIPSSMANLYIGNRLDTTGSANGHIKQIMYLPRRLANADMQTLTT